MSFIYKPYIYILWSIHFKMSGEFAWTTLPKVHYRGLIKLSETQLEMCLKTCFYIEWCNVVSFDSEATLPCEIEISSSDVRKSNEIKDSVTTYLVDKAKVASGE